MWVTFASFAVNYVAMYLLQSNNYVSKIRNSYLVWDIAKDYGTNVFI